MPQMMAPPNDPLAELQRQLSVIDNPQPQKPTLQSILEAVGRGFTSMDPRAFQQQEFQRQDMANQQTQQKRQALAQQIADIQNRKRQGDQDRLAAEAHAAQLRNIESLVAERNTPKPPATPKIGNRNVVRDGFNVLEYFDEANPGVVTSSVQVGPVEEKPKPAANLTPFELWAQQNPDAKVADWFALQNKNDKPTATDQEWVYRNGELTPIPKGTARPGDRPYDSKNAPAPGPSPYANERTTRTLQSVDELMNKVSGWTTGFGAMADLLPTSDARNFKAELDTLKANIAFNELTAMREASKTGGALGQVSDRELGLLESALGALDTRQTAEQFKAQLLKIRSSVERWQKEKARMDGAAPQAQPQGQRGQGGAVIRFDNKGNRIR